MSVMYKNGSSWQDLMLQAYPVGAIYLSYTSTSPASLFGGSWNRIYDDDKGRALGVTKNNTVGNNPGGDWNFDGTTYAQLYLGQVANNLIMIYNQASTSQVNQIADVSNYDKKRKAYSLIIEDYLGWATGGINSSSSYQMIQLHGGVVPALYYIYAWRRTA